MSAADRPTLLESDKELSVVCHPHPTLRFKSQPIKRVDATLKELVNQMFQLMYENKGVGLAANQVGMPLQLFVINTTGKKGEGEEMVFLNPVLSKPKGSDQADEGCLSLPGVYGMVTRPAQIEVSAFDISGNRIEGQLDGFLAKVVQHEFDHLNGTMFFDRMTEHARADIAGEIEEFEVDYQSRLQTGQQETDQQIEEKVQRFLGAYC